MCLGIHARWKMYRNKLISAALKCSQGCDRYKDFVSPNQIQNQIRLVLLVLTDTKIQYQKGEMANFVSPNQIQIQIGLVLLVRAYTHDGTSQPWWEPMTCLLSETYDQWKTFVCAVTYQLMLKGNMSSLSWYLLSASILHLWSRAQPRVSERERGRESGKARKARRRKKDFLRRCTKRGAPLHYETKVWSHTCQVL